MRKQFLQLNRWSYYATATTPPLPHLEMWQKKNSCCSPSSQMRCKVFGKRIGANELKSRAYLSSSQSRIHAPVTCGECELLARNWSTESYAQILWNDAQLIIDVGERRLGGKVGGTCWLQLICHQLCGASKYANCSGKFAVPLAKDSAKRRAGQGESA